MLDIYLSHHCFIVFSQFLNVSIINLLNILSPIGLCSIEYWFRCMDVDGDGVLSMFELEYFYEEQCERMERMGIEPLPFQDLLCQMLDLVKPENPG